MAIDLVPTCSDAQLTRPSRPRPRVGVLTGYWSTNIGNAFFQLGAEWVLRRVLPDALIFPIGDQPGYINVRRGNPANALDYVKHLDLDAVVVLGPYCRPEQEAITAEMLRCQHDKGAKIIVLAAGMMRYDAETIRLSRRLMAQTPPDVFTTRDRETYEALGDLAAHAYDGIDVATFVSDLHEPIPDDLPPYVVMNFDQIPEPRIVQIETRNDRADDAAAFEFDGRTWRVEPPKWRTALSRRFRVFPFFDSMVPRNGAAQRFGDDMILRTDHRYNPFFSRKVYSAPNTYAGDVPFSYLNIYANARCTFTNRVHACVATVSFGGSAMLFAKTPRAYLLRRLGLDGIHSHPVSVDMAFLNREKARLIGFLGSTLVPMLQPEPTAAWTDKVT